MELRFRLRAVSSSPGVVVPVGLVCWGEGMGGSKPVPACQLIPLCSRRGVFALWLVAMFGGRLSAREWEAAMAAEPCAGSSRVAPFLTDFCLAGRRQRSTGLTPFGWAGGLDVAFTAASGGTTCSNLATLSVRTDVLARAFGKDSAFTALTDLRRGLQTGTTSNPPSRLKGFPARRSRHET